MFFLLFIDGIKIPSKYYTFTKYYSTLTLTRVFLEQESTLLPKYRMCTHTHYFSFIYFPAMTFSHGCFAVLCRACSTCDDALRKPTDCFV